MPVRILERGRYELLEDAHGHRFLALDGKRWYAWISAQRSPILVRTDSNHAIERTLQRGKYFLVDFRQDPKFKDMPHLFLFEVDQVLAVEEDAAFCDAARARYEPHDAQRGDALAAPGLADQAERLPRADRE